jgi:hypothetical protein
MGERLPCLRIPCSTYQKRPLVRTSRTFARVPVLDAPFPRLFTTSSKIKASSATRGRISAWSRQECVMLAAMYPLPRTTMQIKKVQQG